MKFIFVTYISKVNDRFYYATDFRFYLFWSFIYGLHLYAPDVFNTLVSWAAAVFDFVQGLFTKASETVQSKKAL